MNVKGPPPPRPQPPNLKVIDAPACFLVTIYIETLTNLSANCMVLVFAVLA